MAQQKAQEDALATFLKTVERKASDYKISPADLLEITVYREKELDRTVRVSQEGRVSFPLVGVVDIGGKSVIQAAEILSTKLGDFVVEPQVTIFVKEYGNRQVYVLGEVEKPGTFELPTESRLTVLEAISMAGGFTKIAAKDGTRVIRTASGDKSTTLNIDISAITKRGEKDKDVPLQPNDVVFVPQSFF